MATKIHSDKHFEAALKILEKNFGKGFTETVMPGVELKAIPTGHDDLDALLTRGTRGLFKGGICELMGSEGSGKTSLALRTVGNAQKMGGKCIWFDCESAFDEHLAVLNGVQLGPHGLRMPQLSEMASADTGSSENAITLFNVNKVLEEVYQAIASNVFEVVVLDSVAGLAPERILADDFHKDPDKSGISEVARAMSQMLRKIAPACKKTETLAIFINQLRDQPGQYIQNRFHTTGGRALRFFANQRISVEKVNGDKGRVYSEVDGAKEQIGHYAQCVIVKNRKAPPVQPGTEIEVPIYYREYFPDDAKKCYDLARRLQVVTIRNGTLTWKEMNTKILEEKGESGFLEKIRNEKLESKLAAACVAASQEEKNMNLKNPVRVPSNIKDLADSLKVSDSEAPEKKPKRKTTSPAIDLD